VQFGALRRQRIYQRTQVDKMTELLVSIYTDREHEKALSQTLYWMERQPFTDEECYAYGEYQYSLKDYREAVIWYRRAIEKHWAPAAAYKLAYCMKHSLGTEQNNQLADLLFKQVIVDAENEAAVDSISFTAQGKYRLGMCYTYGYGTAADPPKGIAYFSRVQEMIPDALYEIGLAYKEGKGGYPFDPPKAAACFRKAYDNFCEDAIFALFEMFDGSFEDFPYIREIKEAYSFKLGRLMRVAELKPCQEYWIRLADFYQQGYPGDGEAGLEKFNKLARKYYMKAGIYNVEK
jgi:hypothetical protein